MRSISPPRKDPRHARDDRVQHARHVGRFESFDRAGFPGALAARFAKKGAEGDPEVRAKEKSCGELNHFIPDARACALRHNHSPDDFGSITGDINLW